MITGTCFDIVHCNKKESSYWHDKVIAYDQKDWLHFFEHMKESKIDTLILLTVVARGKALFPNHPFLETFNFPDTTDRLEMILNAADETDISIFIPIGHQENFAHEMIYSKDAIKRSVSLAKTLLQRYDNHKSFMGWYISDEFGFDTHGAFNSEPIQYSAEISGKLKNMAPNKPRMISPYFHPGCGSPDYNKLTKQLELLNIDILCVQDGANNPQITKEYFETIRKACDTSSTKLWGNIELFQWEKGDIANKTALIPAEFDGVKQRIENFSPFADKLISYQFMGLMNNIGLGKQPEASDLWKKYMNYIIK